MKAGPSGNNMSTNRSQFPELGWEKNICLKSRGSKNETHSYDAPVCSLSVLLLSHKQRKHGIAASCPCWDFQTKLFRIQYFSATTCQKKMNFNEHIMMKNARNMYSKKTLNTENHTKIVWQLPHTQAAANLTKSKPATLVKHCCADLEHRTIATPYIAPLHPRCLHHCTP